MNREEPPEAWEARVRDAETEIDLWAASRVAAQELLRVDDSVHGADLWHAFETLRDRDPRQEGAAHDAYWQLRSPAPDPRRIERARRGLKLSRIRLEHARSLGWPEAWDLTYMPKWLGYGGTTESARVWAEAGWTPNQIFDMTEELGAVETLVVAVDVPTAPGSGR